MVEVPLPGRVYELLDVIHVSGKTHFYGYVWRCAAVKQGDIKLLKTKDPKRYF